MNLLFIQTNQKLITHSTRSYFCKQ